MSPMFKSSNPRDLLNEIKWKGFDPGHCRIYYVHRGAPHDTKIISGAAVRTIGRSFFETIEGTFIPYHRIFRIDFDENVVYERC